MFLNFIILLLWSFFTRTFFKGFIFFYLIPLDSLTSEVGTIERVPTLGHQPVVLGGFYSAVKNQFIPGLSILPSKEIKDYINVINHPIQRTEWTHNLGLHEKLKLLDIEIGGSVTVDLDAGTELVAGGSFHYLEVEEVIFLPKF